ncbi:MAG: SpoIID/LytB domain-containing protein [Phycisphaerales bacterium]|nr:SpoIID/LytB domain-containing protein [Phycisphaerae bacterium]NNF43571.1 SpoIID/LytB domain-containing protein [Phycisphaerales bacterium]NNM24629.1 SpoIID/LytB domain-containing protein [Phycisphaerales bacterium]
MPYEGPPLPAGEPTVRVRILTVRRGNRPRAFDVEGGWMAVSSHPRAAARVATPPETVIAGFGGVARRPPAAPEVPTRTSDATVLHAPVRARLEPGGWSLRDDRGFRTTAPADEAIALTPVGNPGDAAATVFIEGESYPGHVRLVPHTKTAGRYDVVNHVPLESYLPGVLAGELYAFWRPATFEAQAVAARSYACSELAYRARRAYDLTSTARSQVYGSETHEAADEGVARTRGMFLAYNGRLVPGYYSSCCGGVAADAVDVIGDHPYNAAPPLRGRAGVDVCAAAPLYTWTIERDRDDVTTRLALYGRANDNAVLADLHRVARIDVGAANRHGRPTAFVITNHRGETTQLEAETFRRVVDSTRGGRPRPKKPLWSSNLQVAIDDATVRFEGGGHGHGAGLCQHGAETLARSGRDAAEILEWYYPGVELYTAY